MAETLVSPGVLARENDQSFITQQPVQVGAAIVGPTVKGPVEIPTIVTSYSDYQNRFGTTFESGSDEYSFMTNITAYNYFQNGGNTMLVTRVVSGSNTWDYSSAAIPASGSGTSFTIEAIDKGIIFKNSASNGVNLIPGGSGSLYSGSSDNIRWEIANSSQADGSFNLLVRQGNDNNNNKIVLESWTNLSLDPKADNYVAKVIGDQHYNYNVTENYIEITGSYANASRYIRVKSVTAKTPNYFDNAGNAKLAFTESVPQVGSGSYGGTFTGGVGSVIPSGRTMNLYGDINATDTQGLVGSDYNNMLTYYLTKMTTNLTY